MAGTQDPHPFHLGASHRSPRLFRALGLLAPIGLLGVLPGCITDPDCGVCDPDNLILESIAGVNYAGKLVRLLGPECVGDECPGEITQGSYFVEKIIPCAQTDDARAAGRGVEEWCKVSPMVVDTGLQFIFNNLLDPTSVELVRKQARNPQLFEVFDWKTQIVHLEGPITRFNGDYLRGATQNDPDRISRAQNLSCIDNLRLQHVAYDHTILADDPAICDGTHEGPDGKQWPLRAQIERADADGRRAPTTVETWRGETDTRQIAQSCTPPQSGPDTCCELCDYELAVNVAKYGVTGGPLGELELAGERRRGLADAITCDPDGDKLAQCRDFVPHVYRGTEVRSHEYLWNGERQRFRVPRADKTRETHPDDRPADAEQRTVPCFTDEDCTSSGQAGLPGMECVGHRADDPGTGCREGDDCIERRCVAEWFVDCRPDDNTGEQGYCVDRRWSGQGVAACFTSGAPFYICEDTETCAGEDFGDPSRRQASGSRLSLADSDGDGRLESIEACRDSLGGADKVACDPLFQADVAPIDRYDRLESLPTETRTCLCEEEPRPGCRDFVDSLCRVGADPSAPIAPEKLGQYAVKFVSRPGGVVYDPAIKGVQFLPADLGGVPRSLVEACSEDRSKGAGPLNVKDGWRANDLGAELYEDADRAMCSSSEYRVVFNAEPGAGDDPLEYIRDKLGNTLRGKSTYMLRTPDFHVVPGSGFPTDNLRIGACAAFELRFSNKYDLGADNLRKLQLVEISLNGEQELRRVAGGRDCAPDNSGELPCLTIDVLGQDSGAIKVSIDTQLYGSDHLEPGHRYRLKVPGLELAPGETVFDVIAAGGDRYTDAFWDACGMPLVTAMPRLDGDGLSSAKGKRRAPDSLYDFTIDDPKPKEDQEQDGVQFSCDNAPDDFNPEQEDMDNDGFGDIVDLCPTVPDPNNKADTDKDAVGNVCDRCPRQTDAYNTNAEASPAEVYMRVRNIPHQGDADQDGVGDVCDNCVVRANCGDFGPSADGLRPAGVGDPVPHENAGVCQADVDALPFIGDACAPGGVPLQLPGAAAPVGLTNNDDFDQDGLINLLDRCPRQPIARVDCETAEDCEAKAVCTDGMCNHVDSDNDGHGDLCDSCPFAANASQSQDGGIQSNDLDGDFVGAECESTPACANSLDARRIAFYSEVSNGQCCVQMFDEALGLVDPGLARVGADGICEVIDPVVPIKVDCPEDQINKTCRPLPQQVRERPGIVTLPQGCAAAGTPLALDSPGIDGDEDKLYGFMCLLPQSDQDFDGIGDACDLCKFAFDPENSFYKDANNKVWPTSGMFCNGDYDPEREQQSCSDLEGGSSSSGSESGDTGSTG